MMFKKKPYYYDKKDSNMQLASQISITLTKIDEHDIAWQSATKTNAGSITQRYEWIGPFFTNGL